MTNNSTPNRDDYRGKILAGVKGPTKILTFNGMDVEFHHLTIDQLDVINDKEGNRLVNMIIATAYIPGTNEKIFEAGDAETLKGLTWSPEITKLQEFYGTMYVGDVEGAEKNSVPTS